MSTKNWNAAGFVTLAGVVAGTLVACGGSSDDGAGGQSTFQVSPDKAEVTSSVGTCPLAKVGDYTIVGGVAPYTVKSPYHQLVSFGAAGAASNTHFGEYVVSNHNGQFALFIQGCFDPATITILDGLNRLAVLPVSYKASS